MIEVSLDYERIYIYEELEFLHDLVVLVIADFIVIFDFELIWLIFLGYEIHVIFHLEGCEITWLRYPSFVHAIRQGHQSWDVQLIKRNLSELINTKKGKWYEFLKLICVVFTLKWGHE